MPTTEELNDPEYRWYHKEEMSKIMPSPTERKRFGIVVLDYEKLRAKNDAKIKPSKERQFDWARLKYIVETVPKDYDSKSRKRSALNPKERLHFEKKGKGRCFICSQVNYYGSNNRYSNNTCTVGSISHLHHITPNGDASDDNIITLCVHCHQVVHQLLFLTGRCRFGRPL